MVSPQILGDIQDPFSGKTRAKALGIYGIIVGLSTALGPVVGGLLLTVAGTAEGWRLVFLINVPIGLVVVPLGMKMLQKDVPASTARSKSLFKTFDPIGLLLLAIIVLAIMWPFLESSGQTSGSMAKASYWLLGVAAALVIAMLPWEKAYRRGGGVALLDPRLYKNSSFVLGVTASFFYFAGFTAIFLIMTLYLQQGRGWTPLASGLALVPFALASGFPSGLSGRLVNRFGRVVPLTGTLIVIFGMLATAASAQWLPEHYAPIGIIISLTVAGIGSGLFISPNQALTLENIEVDSAGLAAALLQTFQRLGSAIGLAVVTTIYFVISRKTPASGSGLSKEVLLVDAHSHALVISALCIIVTLTLAVAANLVDVVRRKDVAPSH